MAERSMHVLCSRPLLAYISLVCACLRASLGGFLASGYLRIAQLQRSSLAVSSIGVGCHIVWAGEKGRLSLGQENQPSFPDIGLCKCGCWLIRQRRSSPSLVAVVGPACSDFVVGCGPPAPLRPPRKGCRGFPGGGCDPAAAAGSTFSDRIVGLGPWARSRPGARRESPLRKCLACLGAQGRNTKPQLAPLPLPILGRRACRPRFALLGDSGPCFPIGRRHEARVGDISLRSPRLAHQHVSWPYMAMRHAQGSGPLGPLTSCLWPCALRLQGHPCAVS